MKKPLRILLVEDEVISAMYMKMELEEAGYEVCRHVTTGENAVISAENDCPDIVLMDIVLPGKIDGVDAAEKIKNISNIPIIIFLTGFENKDTRERALKLNPIAYLIKPVSISELKSIIDSYFLKMDGTGSATKNHV
jgi:two-component system, response regulator PdtaR